MPIANYSTEVAVEKTMGEVIGSLQRRGVVRISTTYDDEGAPAGVEFTLKTPYGPRNFALPVRTEGVLRAMQRDPKVPKSKQNAEQAARVAWRIAAEWLRAQGALIDAELVTMEEVMLPYMLADQHGHTAYELWVVSQKEITA